MRLGETPLLETFLMEAIYLPDDFQGEPLDLVFSNPRCLAAVEEFGSQPDNRAFIAEA